MTQSQKEYIDIRLRYLNTAVKINDNYIDAILDMNPSKISEVSDYIKANKFYRDEIDFLNDLIKLLY